VNLDAIKTAVEPYVTQVKGYTHQVTDRAESLLETVKHDARVAKFVDAARPVVEIVEERVVKPVRSLTVRDGKATAAAKTAAKPAASKPAATKPATARPATKPTARKAPAKRTTQS